MPKGKKQTKKSQQNTTERTLLSLVEAEHDIAIGFWNDALTESQDASLRRYYGLPYGDEVSGRSSAVSRDCAQVVDWALPDLLEPFLNNNNLVKFKPNKKEDIEAARQASDYTNLIFWEDNNGFQNLYDGFKDGLIQKVGIAKVWWDDQKREIDETIEGVTVAQLGALEADNDVEIGAVRPLETLTLPSPDGSNGAIPIELVSVDITRTVGNGRVKIEVIPPEEFLISPRAANKDAAAYLAHESRQTRSTLLEMGFDKKLVDGLPMAGDDEQRRTRNATRFFDEDRSGDTGESSDETQQDVVLIEEYIKTDINNDGDTELVQVFRVGSIILEWREVDDHPFESFCPEMIPHKFFGQSLVDKTVETQRIKTVLTRQLLDGVYLANNPQREVPDDAVGDNTIQDLLTYRVGGLVRTRRPGMLREIPITDRSTTALGAIQYFDNNRGMDTGITGNSAGAAIDINKEQTRAEVESVERRESSRKRLVARVGAETFVKQIYKKILALTIQYQDYERIVELRGEWVAVNPKYWDANMSGVIQVGLGHAERSERLQSALMIGQLQEKALEIGMASPEQLYNTADVIVQASGLQFTELFFIHPRDIPKETQQPEKDPKLAKVEADAQAQQQKLKNDFQVNMARVQMDGQVKTAQAQQDAQIKDAIAKRDSELDREKAASDFKIDLNRINSEFQLGLRQLVVETELKQEEMRIETALAIQAGSVNGELKSVGQDIRFGGKVG